MKESVVPLLTLGNSKLGAAIFVWSLPAIDTCPGSTSLCRGVCYATKSRYRFQKVRDRLAWCFEQSRRPDFTERMIQEVKRIGALVVRIHAAGDYYDAEYASKWLEVMKACPRVRFYYYSRSWVVPEIAPVLEQMAALKCCRAWYSVDAETGIPRYVPPGVRLAFLQVTEDNHPEQVDLVFRIRKLRNLASLPIICGAETVEGKAQGMNCGFCQRCFQ